MLPEPLHPAIVHFPIVFVALLPLVAIIALILLRRGSAVRPTWGWVVVLAVMLSVSAWVAVETGEEQEELVEEVVPESAIHDHEEAAELFLYLTLGGLVVVGLGLAPGRTGMVGRYAGTACAFALLVAGMNTGRTGGELVYEHGAAQAYLADGLTREDGIELRAGRARDDDDGDHRRDRR